MFRKLLRRLKSNQTTSILMAMQTNFEGLSDYASYLSAACGKLWATWRALDIVSNAVASTPFTIQGPDGPVKSLPKDLDRLLRYPNQKETVSDFLYRLTFHLKATGNAYAYKAEATLDGERPRELWLLNPRKVRIAVDSATGKLTGYTYRRDDGTIIPFEPEEIIHWFKPHPNNDYYGLGEIEAGEQMLQEVLNHDVWQRAFWKNGAAPSGILICEDAVTDEEEWERAKARWQAQYGGSEKAGKTAWLSGKWRYERLGLSVQEMQDIERSRLSIENIYTLHGVPLSVVGIREAANYATAEIDDERFRTYTVKPLLTCIGDTLTTDLLTGYGSYRFVFQPMTVIQAQVVMSVATAFDRGLISINEARAALGLPTDPDNPAWNQHYITAGLVPLELSGVSLISTGAERAAEQMVRDFATSALREVAVLRRNGDGEFGFHRD